MFDFTHLSTRLRRFVAPRADRTRDPARYPGPTDAWVRLDRFLVHGDEGGSRYLGARAPTAAHVNALAALASLVAEDGARVVARVMDVRIGGRTQRHAPALLVLALAAIARDAATRALAREALPVVARTAAQRDEFDRYVAQLHARSTALRSLVS